MIYRDGAVILATVTLVFSPMPAEAGEAGCSRSGACGCYAVFRLTQPLVVRVRPQGVSRTSDNGTFVIRAIMEESIANPPAGWSGRFLVE